MKKLYIILALIVVSILMVFAGDTIKILRIYHNGTFTAIPLANIDSIDHSRFDANGKLQPNYASIIETLDSTYNISISEIDSVVVTEDANIGIITDDLALAINKINPYFLKCESTAELSSYVDQFLSEEYIDNVWYDETTFFVKTKDGNTFTFTYPPLPQNETANKQESRSLSRRAQDISEGHEHLENMKNVYLVNQTYNDEQFDFTSDIIESMRQDFTDCGFKATIINSPTFSFFLNDIRNCDILYLQTHGSYNKEYDLHWILTGDEIYTLEVDEKVTDDKKKEIEEIYNSAVNGKRYSRQHVNVGSVKEKRGNGYKSVCYIKISELFVRDNMPRLNKTIIFNTACQSLKEDEDKEGEEVAKYFIEKGACCYMGYTETNNTGHYAAREFFRNLLNGKSIGKAYNNLDSKYVYNQSAKLDYYPNESSNYCIISPQTDEYENMATNNEWKIKLRGNVSLYYPMLAGNTYGFCISKDKTMTNRSYLPPLSVGNENCPYSDHTLIFEYPLDMNTKVEDENLESNTTYYYCAYLNDGNNYCYGNIRSFKTGNNGENINPDDNSPEVKAGICPDSNHPHMIDLGLPSGTLWSCCNVGAYKPQQYGGYYSYGEILEKNDYTWYSYMNKSDQSLPFPSIYYDIPCDLGGSHYDVAYICNKKWMTPTYEQLVELNVFSDDKVSYYLDGVYGLLIKGKNGNKLFLPCSGYKMASGELNEFDETVYRDGKTMTIVGQIKENGICCNKNSYIVARMRTDDGSVKCVGLDEIKYSKGKQEFYYEIKIYGNGVKEKNKISLSIFDRLTGLEYDLKCSPEFSFEPGQTIEDIGLEWPDFLVTYNDIIGRDNCGNYWAYLILYDNSQAYLGSFGNSFIKFNNNSLHVISINTATQSSTPTFYNGASVRPICIP